MSLAYVAFDTISEGHLQALIEHGVAEGLLYDYKRDMYGNADDDKREVLKDFSGLANASGGHLIIGVEENEGMPTNLVGVAGNADEHILRLDNLLRDCMQPRIVGLRIRAVALGNGTSAIVARIPKSWNPPHAACYRGIRRFYVRHSASTAEADMDELRGLFTTSTSLTQRVRTFRNERASLIAAGEGPVDLPGGGKVIMHVVPSSALTADTGVDLNRLTGSGLLGAIGTHGYNYGWNFDGIIAAHDVPPTAYTQVFRNGIIETVASNLMRPANDHRPAGFHAGAFEGNVCRAIEEYTAALALLEVPAPVIILINLRGVRGMSIIGGAYHPAANDPLRQDELLLPPVTLSEYGSMNERRDALKPMFDALWNAGGFARSENYDAEGHFIDRRAH